MWQQENFGLVAIVGEKKKHNLYYSYSKYVLENDHNELLNGTKISTIHRTKYPSLFIIFERSDHIVDDNDTTLTGKLMLGDNNKKASVLIRGSDKLKKINKTYSLNKVFP